MSVERGRRVASKRPLGLLDYSATLSDHLQRTARAYMTHSHVFKQFGYNLRARERYIRGL
jgi:hypothetical protein